MMSATPGSIIKRLTVPMNTSTACTRAIASAVDKGAFELRMRCSIARQES